MAPLPASLKPIHPYLNKAEEMKTADPVVSYYCNYWAVQYAITLGLKDPEANVFLASLLDSLEKTKTSMSGTEAITDEIVGKAYMENFAGNIFSKADNEERSNKATRTTATKFLAASHFMEVLRCFGDLDKETSDKIKYAKFQCARILKAIKAGEDPNTGSPVVEDEPIPILPYVSPSKTAPTMVQAPVDGKVPPIIPMNPVPSVQSHNLGSSNLGQQNNVPPPSPFSTNQFATTDSSSPPPPPPRPSPPSTFSPSLPINPYSSINPPAPNQFSSQPPSQFSLSPPPRPPQYPSQAQDPSNYYISNPAQQRPDPPSIGSPSNYYTQASASPRQPAPQPLQPQPIPSYFPPQQPQVVVDDEAMAKAQKHARWAISALNYEDVETAVKELKNALNTLGVRN